MVVWQMYCCIWWGGDWPACSSCFFMFLTSLYFNSPSDEARCAINGKLQNVNIRLPVCKKLLPSELSTVNSNRLYQKNTLISILNLEWGFQYKLNVRIHDYSKHA